MPPSKLRPELETTGVLTNDLGVEIARLTLNGLLIINLAEVYFETIRWGSLHGGKCKVTHLYQVFSRTGGRGFDMEVHAAIKELETIKVIEFVDETHIRVSVSPTVALKVIPPYATRAEVHAGLEALQDE